MFFSYEFYAKRTVQGGLAVLSLIYFVIFSWWVQIDDGTTTEVVNQLYICPRHFQACESLYFLTSLPNGYSHSLWYMLLFGALLWVVYLLVQKKWREAALVLLLPYTWHAITIFLLSNDALVSFEYYVFIFATVLLFLPHKEFFIKLLFVLLYVLSTFIKIHPAWIAGSYFTNLQLGLPFVPDAFIPIVTNIVILMEMVGAWFLLSKHPILQRTVFAFFVFFHLYSGIFVEYRFPVTALPVLLIFFGPWYQWTPPPLTRRSLLGWSLAASLIALQLIPIAIPGDEKLTLEGNVYGLYMFESNHQCISTVTYHLSNGSELEDVSARKDSRYRCDPYRHWFRLNELCEHDPKIARISWQFDHSINGDDFLRIVDTEDACSLEYKPFSHNEWIKTHADNPEAVGKPVKNTYKP